MSILGLLALTPVAAGQGAAGDTTRPTKPTGLIVKATSPTSITLGWDASTDDVGVVGYYLVLDGMHYLYLDERAETRDAFTLRQYTFGSLACGSSHTIGVQAWDASKNVSDNALVIAATAPCYDAQAPSAPSGLRQTASSDTSATISWSGSSDNTGVAGYGAYQGSVRIGQTQQLSYAFTGLKCGSSTSVAVDAYDAAGNRSSQTPFVVTTGKCSDTQAPSVPTGLALATSSGTSLSVSWRPSTDDTGVAGYVVLLGGSSSGTTTQTQYSLTGLSCGKSYVVGVQAYDAAGNKSAVTSATMGTPNCPPTGGGGGGGGGTGSGDTQPPTAPSGLTLASSSTERLTVSWKASYDHNGVAGYTVLLGGSSSGTTTQTQYTVTGLSCGKSYVVGVQAYDAAGNKSAVTTATMGTASCAKAPTGPSSDTQAPTVPPALTVQSTTSTSVVVAWGQSTDNVGVAGYGVYRGSSQVGDTSQITYSLTGLSCGTSYTVAVDAYDAAGNRSARKSGIVSTSPCTDASPPTTPTNVTMSGHTTTSISLSWTASTDNVGVVGYEVYSAGAKVGSPSATSYTVTGLACGQSYTIGVLAYDASGNKSAQTSVLVSTSTCGDTQPPSGPTGLVAKNPTQTSVSLSWNASTDNVGVAGYDVFVNGIKMGTATTTSYVLSSLGCDASLTVGVEAFDAAGNRSARATVNAATTACPNPQSAVNLAVAPNGNDANPCTQTAPCASFDRAYHLAQPGAVVQVAAGSYPGQRLTHDATKVNAPSDVVFAPAPGASPTFADSNSLNFGSTAGPGAEHVELRNFTMEDVGVQCGGNVTFRNMHIRMLNVISTNGFLMTGGEVGPHVDGVSQVKSFGSPGCMGDGTDPPANNVTFDGVFIHDFTITDPTTHSECFQTDGAVSNLTFRDNTFQNCTDFDVFIDSAGSNILFENNMMDAPLNQYPSEPCNPGCARGGNSIRIEDRNPTSNVTIRYNTVLGGIGIDPNVANTTVVGNIATGIDKAGPYNIQGNPAQYVVDGNPLDGTMNLHLKPGSAAINVGDPGAYPSSDIDGQGRPMGGRSDVGADESG